ncbi:P-II family nitrogen regulator [Brevibacterium sp. 5221]|uniref:P-II family nitrogen regulator n=1 Tax=Brevibacterium rongguiense TaxID=2695267 RepID=A0A6N9H7M2_9MICO|nr:P-II family nitrogen regulator [Brevibacterium rongguiense]MYM20078.1 P-II family nitrogen regulator [Brevibacterium rongguiense]
MKLITAIIRPSALETVRAALEDFGVQGMTVSEASGYGRQKGHKQVYRGASYSGGLVAKLRLEVLSSDADSQAIVDAILAAASSGKPGDGKIWVVDVAEAARVSDRSTGDAAI